MSKTELLDRLLGELLDAQDSVLQTERFWDDMDRGYNLAIRHCCNRIKTLMSEVAQEDENEMDN